jgi:hypothetical protein
VPPHPCATAMGSQHAASASTCVVPDQGFGGLTGTFTRMASGSILSTLPEGLRVAFNDDILFAVSLDSETPFADDDSYVRTIRGFSQLKILFRAFKEDGISMAQAPEVQERNGHPGGIEWLCKRLNVEGFHETLQHLTRVVASVRELVHAKLLKCREAGKVPRLVR